MPQLRVEISFDRSHVYECGAAVLAILASPDSGSISEGRRAELHASLCCHALWAKFLSNPDDCEPITVRPQHVFRGNNVVARDIKFVQRRLRERLIVARIAIPFLQKSELGRSPDLPSGVRRLSVNEMAAKVLEDAEQAEASNVKQRYWVPS